MLRSLPVHVSQREARHYWLLNASLNPFGYSMTSSRHLLLSLITYYTYRLSFISYLLSLVTYLLSLVSDVLSLTLALDTILQ